MGSHLSPKPTLGQPHIDEGKVGLVASAEGDRLGDRRRDTANLIPALRENLFDHVGHHQIVLDDQDLEHV